MKKTIFTAVFFSLFGFGFSQSIFTESFEGTFPPAGWTVLNVEGTNTWDRTISYFHSGVASAYHQWASSHQKTALITPQIQIPSTGEAELEFWSRFQLYNNPEDIYSVLISNTVNNNINAFTEVRVLAGSELNLAVWKKINVSLQAYAGQNVYIAFYYNAQNGSNWYIDDVKINHLASFVDIQPLGITPVSNDYPLFSNNEPISVRIKNNGGASASGFEVKLYDNDVLKATEIFNGSVPSLGEVTYNFTTKLDLSVPGMHKVQVVTNLAGDQVPENNTATSMINNLGCAVINTFPYFEGFEGNGNNLPPCWTQELVAENYKWKVCNAAYAQGIGGLEPTGAFEGDYKAYFYTHGKDGAITKLIAPPMNLTSLNNPVLKFHHIQQFYAGDQDSLKIYYRTGFQSPWVFLEKYTETIADWTERIIPLPEPSAQYYIAFEAYAEYGHSVQIDAVTIDDYFGKDIEVKDINPKGVHVGLSSQQEIKATIKNNGRDPVTGFELSLFFNEALVAKEVFNNTIPGLGEAVYTFNMKVDLSVSGTYLLKVVADFEGDEAPENNELTVTVKNLVCNAITFPYDEGFEESIFPPSCWTKVGEWKQIHYSTHTGNGKARYSWADGSLGWLITPKFSLPAGSDFMLEFWSYIYEKKYFTYSGVWISTTNNNTSSFTEILSLNGDLIPDEVWKRIEVPLKQYAGKDIYIAFKYTSSGGQSGHMWSVDDINVFNLSNHIDAEVVEITAPPTLGMNLTSAEPVTVKIKNNGGSNIGGFKLILECNGTVVATETYSGYINSLASVSYTFNKKVNLSAAGHHTIKVTVVLEGDMNPNNDSKTKVIENWVCPPVTVFPWEGEFQGITAGTIADCWMNIDADGDTKKWRSLEAGGNYYAVSQSYDSVSVFPLSPDNWLITPLLTLSQVCTLVYKVGGSTSEQSSAEKYSVLVSKKGLALADFVALRTETLYPSDYTEMLVGELSDCGLKTVKVPLSLYKGETVHIAFRHWDCTAQDKLIVSDIKVVTELSVNEANDDFQRLTARVENGSLYVERLNIGETLEVYSVVGNCIYKNVVRSETARITLNSRGVYIVKSGEKVLKVVY